MSEEIHAKILSFLSAALAREGLASASKIELLYAQHGGYRMDPLRVWSRSNETDRPYFESLDEQGNHNHVYVQALTSEVLELAEGHADSFGSGRHRFVLRVYQPSGSRPVHAFVILPSVESGDDQALAVGGSGSGQAELVPTAAGLQLQLMRHLEQRDRNQKELIGSFLNAIGHHAEQMREENAQLRTLLAAKDKERMEWLTTIEEARSLEHSRQIEAQQVVAREERRTHATKKITSLLPVFLSQWMGSGKPKLGKDGKPVPQTPPGPLAKMVKQLLFSLTEEQRGQLASVLSMEQQISLGEIVEVVQNGDSPLLSTMLHDMVSTLQPRQVGAMMTIMTAEQQAIFVKAIQLAQAAAEPKPDETAAAVATTNGANTPTNGTATETEPGTEGAS